MFVNKIFTKGFSEDTEHKIRLQLLKSFYSFALKLIKFIEKHRQWKKFRLCNLNESQGWNLNCRMVKSGTFIEWDFLELFNSRFPAWNGSRRHRCRQLSTVKSHQSTWSCATAKPSLNRMGSWWRDESILIVKGKENKLSKTATICSHLTFHGCSNRLLSASGSASFVLVACRQIFSRWSNHGSTGKFERKLPAQRKQTTQKSKLCTWLKFFH